MSKDVGVYWVYAERLRNNPAGEAEIVTTVRAISHRSAVNKVRNCFDISGIYALDSFFAVQMNKFEQDTFEEALEKRQSL